MFGLQKLMSIAYDKLPIRVRVFIAPVLEPVSFTVRRALSIVNQLHLPVYKLRGKNKWNDGTLTTLLLGEGSGMLPYLLSLLYIDKPSKEKIGKVFLWRMKSQIDSCIPSADLVLIGIDGVFSKLLSRQGFIVIPEWVMLNLDPTKPLPRGNRSKALKNNLRKVKKYAYSFAITQDFEEFKNFYYHMYLPYAENRYGNLSIVGGFRDLRKIFEKGLILQVKLANETIAGALLEVNNRSISVRVFGVKDGSAKYLEEGVMAACYYFTIDWAKDKGCEWIEFGHCRPFFHDGAFNHKKTWGMEITKSNRFTFPSRAVFGMKVSNYEQGLQKYLATNPFIAIDQGVLKGLLLTEQEAPLTCEEIQVLYRTYYMPGIDSLIISSSQGFTQEAEEFASGQSPQRIYLKNLSSNIFC